jgi:class 3 adenylate cyclase/HAMP domain-containing protein
MTNQLAAPQDYVMWRRLICEGVNRVFRSPFGSSLCLRLVLLPVLVMGLGAAGTALVTFRNIEAESARQSHDAALRLWDAVSSAQPAVAPDADKAQPAYTYRRVRNSPASPTKPDGYESQLITSFSTGGMQKLDGTTVRDGQPCYVIAAPLKDGEAVDGVEALYVPVGDGAARTAAAYWTAFKLLGLLTILAALILTWRTYILVAVPLRRLLATSQALRRGEWGARFTMGSKDEVAALAHSFQDTTHWLREQIVKEEKLRALFQQFIPASVAAKALGKNPETVLAGTRHSVTVMIINIRNFRLLVDNLQPEQTVATLNEYFSEINRVIVANKGVVSKYLGDTVMAIFGMPLGNNDHALLAIRAGLSIPRALQDLYVRMEDRHGWELGVGIGIATGEPIVGHFGSSEHMEYAVLGDVVVDAHRMEELTKSVPEEDTILICEETYRAVMSEVHVYDMGEKQTSDGRTVHPYVVQGFRSEARSVLAA